MDWMESLVERRIREAVERGDFDNLPGAGRPLDLRDADDPNWWLKSYLRREKIDPAVILPAALALRREAAQFPESLRDLADEEAVRAVLTDFNARVAAQWRRPDRGPALPVQPYQVEVEDQVAAWRRLRADGSPPDAEPAPAAPAPQAGPTGRRRRWFAFRAAARVVPRRPPQSS